MSIPVERPRAPPGRADLNQESFIGAGYVSRTLARRILGIRQIVATIDKTFPKVCKS